MGGACCRRASSFHLPLSPRTSCAASWSAARLARSFDSLVQSCAHSGNETTTNQRKITPIGFMGTLRDPSLSASEVHGGLSCALRWRSGSEVFAGIHRHRLALAV